MGPAAVPADPTELVSRVRRLAASRSRVVVGIAGAPGAGKSTLAAAVVAGYGPGAVLVGMDGFHLAQRVLDQAGTAPVKGAPETFDAAGYVALLERLAEPASDVVYAPEFRRDLEEPIAGAVAVPPATRVVVTEGNYLLLDEAPWNRVRALCTEVWFLDVPDDERVDRLVRRHVRFGRLPDEARDRAVTGTDGRNAGLVLASRGRADLLLITPTVTPAVGPTRNPDEALGSAHRTG
ncbi:nucleoside/nucleotide kinase family protein [Nakamurella sp. GG22]